MKKINITAFLLCSWFAFLFWSGQALAAEQCEVTVQLQQNGVTKTEAVNGLSGDMPFLLLRDFSDLTGQYVHWFSDSGAIGWTTGTKACFIHPRSQYIYIVEGTPIYEEQMPSPKEITPEIKSFVPTENTLPVAEGEGEEISKEEVDKAETERESDLFPEETGTEETFIPESAPVLVGWEYAVKKEKLPTPLAVEKDQTYLHSSLLVYLGYDGVWQEPLGQYDMVKQDSGDLAIPLTLEEAYSKVKETLLKDLPAKEEVLGRYKTSFNPGEKNRTINLKLAAAAINGQVIQPGKTFSFNKTVGPRTRERGYLEATIFVGGKKEQGLGGGICQVSSTLYNAVLKSKLKVVERHTHSLPVTYVPTGKDATVSYGYLDFRFQNNQKYPIKIQAVVNKNTLDIAFISVDK